MENKAYDNGVQLHAYKETGIELVSNNDLEQDSLVATHFYQPTFTNHTITLPLHYLYHTFSLRLVARHFYQPLPLPYYYYLPLPLLYFYLYHTFSLRWMNIGYSKGLVPLKDYV